MITLSIVVQCAGLFSSLSYINSTFSAHDGPTFGGLAAGACGRNAPGGCSLALQLTLRMLYVTL